MFVLFVRINLENGCQPTLPTLPVELICIKLLDIEESYYAWMLCTCVTITSWSL